MEDFHKYLTDGGDAEKSGADLVRQGLAGLQQEAKLQKVAEARRVWLRRQFWFRAVALAAGLLVAGAIAFWFWPKKTPAPGNFGPENPPGNLETKFQTPDNQPVEPAPAPAEKSAPPKPRGKTTPIAERPKTPREQAEAPLVRSAKPDLDTATNRLLDLLLKVTVHNESQGPAGPYDLDSNVNKASSWGNAVRALLQNRPDAARPHIFDLENYDPDEARWLLGIALLEEGKSDEAAAVFETIARNPKHWRRGAAAAAAAALRQE